MSDHVRVHGSLLAKGERKVLVWLAHRLPRAVSSDHLTLLGLVSVALAGVGFGLMGETAWAPAIVCLGLALNWFGDSLDGTLARVRQDERPRYGFYVDHVVDCMGATFLVAGLAWSGVMSPAVAAAALIGFLLVAAESYLATHSLGIFRLSFSKMGPTELRILLAMGAMAVGDSPWVEAPFVGDVRLFDFGGTIAAVGLAVAFVVSALRNTRALYVAERIDRRAA
jgi:phosphatidylglycerophosphate synthase